ncbi:coiled-coil domain-containing protein 181-like [Clytia hemisphaerica]|uniref:Coiled-coil domain-containing protein 181 n=1 Tax=Clytia hemisphaerica TaxID=252671 RepID=A0A7M5VG06_9CNID
MATGESSTEDELSRDFSTLSTSSSVTSSISRKSNASTLKDDQDGEDLSRQGTTMSDESTSSRPTSGLSSVATASRQNTVGSLRSENNSRQSQRSLSRGSTIRNDDPEVKNNSVSRESSVLSSRNGYDDDFHDDEESSPTSASSRQQSFVGKSPSNDNSDDTESESEDMGKMEKENSVLIEKDGKFELVEERNLTIDQREALGLTKREKRKPNTLNIPASSGRVRKSSNPEYAHLKSEYGMSEQQKEMKFRRVSVMQMRRQEEKERMKQEDEEKKRAADKSFKQWLAQKKETKADKKPATPHQRKKKKTVPSVQLSEEEMQRRELQDRAFKQWIDEKEEQTKDEKKMEEIRLAEEAQNYVVRDRKQCDKAFKEWLKKKKVERQSTPTQTTRKKSTYTPAGVTPTATKKKSLAPIYAPSLEQRRPRSSVRSMAANGMDCKNDVEVKRRPKTSKIRITDNFGYRHPASIDDFIERRK